APEMDRAGSGDYYMAPGTATEELIASIYRQTLGVTRVGANDNFFEMGGHSLLATQVVSRLREAFRQEIPLSSIFECPTVSELPDRIECEPDSALRMSTPAIEAVSRERELPLSFAQQRLWFIHQLTPDSAAYNIPIAIRVEGHVDEQALEAG